MLGGCLDLLQACVLFIGVRKTMPAELCPLLLEVVCAAGDAGARRRSQGAWKVFALRAAFRAL